MKRFRPPSRLLNKEKLELNEISLSSNAPINTTKLTDQTPRPIVFSFVFFGSRQELRDALWLRSFIPFAPFPPLSEGEVGFQGREI